MKIGGVSNVLNKNIASVLLNKNNTTNSQNSPFEKQKSQIQKQINDVEKSNISKEEKASKIKGLEKSLQDIEEKEMAEKAQKVLQNSDAENIKPKKESENSEKTKVENDEGNQVLNKDVMYGLTSASSHMKVGKVAYAVYKDAMLRGKMDVAQRAFSYTSNELNESRKSTKLVAKAINEYKKQLERIKKNDHSNDNKDNISIDAIKEAVTDTKKEISTNINIKEANIVSDSNKPVNTNTKNKNS
ncbi:hypothetical protein [Clostridium scatologenes]|uniref:Uncharacterized protein n=1 Tax=Clostridium scatologenes TaxID=1548 RepID=A0A0E3M702_CLOSL|nr:hypothetical protein [Clostridium scatologenes]AKA68234.1 hypothetical protein CSCA_1109 [Clostridium scatologenes]